MREIGPVKILIVGDAQVGKTSFSKHFNPKRMDNLTLSGSGVDFLNVIEYKYPDKNYLAKIQLMELSADFSNIGMQNMMFHGASGVLVLCDNTNSSTVDNLPTWIARTIKELGEEVPICILINKCDQKPDCVERKKKIEKRLLKSGYQEINYTIDQISVHKHVNLEKGLQFILNSYDFKEQISIPSKLWNKIEKEAKKRKEDPKEFIIGLIERNLES